MGQSPEVTAIHMTQMNTRIDRTLKSQGDEVLARFGYTPSQAIRGLYRFLVAHRHEPAKVDSLVASDENASREEANTEIKEKLEKLHRGWQLCDEFRARHGIGDEAVRKAAEIPHATLLDEARFERFEGAAHE